MKIMISTPAYGGMVTTRYAASLQDSLYRAEAEGLVKDWSLHQQGTESLIPRGRNRDATHFVKGDFDKLLTIDADIEWTYEDFRRLLTSDKPIVGGIYPLKGFPVVANFNPLKDQGTELIKTHRGLDLDALKEFVHKYADPQTGEAEVRHVPTGFMAVRRDVMAKLTYSVETYWTFDPVGGKRDGFYDFYPCGVHDSQYMSEDWNFCRLAKEAGFSVYINTKILLGHVGTHVYRMGQIFGNIK